MATATKKQPIKGKTQPKTENKFFVFKKQCSR